MTLFLFSSMLLAAELVPTGPAVINSKPGTVSFTPYSELLPSDPITLENTCCGDDVSCPVSLQIIDDGDWVVHNMYWTELVPFGWSSTAWDLRVRLGALSLDTGDLVTFANTSTDAGNMIGLDGLLLEFCASVLIHVNASTDEWFSIGSAMHTPTLLQYPTPQHTVFVRGTP